MVKDFKIIQKSGTTIQIIKNEEGELFAYDTAERWNGEYWKGWKCDEYGEDIESATYSIRPIYEGVGTPDEDGEFGVYEIIDYEISK